MFFRKTSLSPKANTDNVPFSFTSIFLQFIKSEGKNSKKKMKKSKLLEYFLFQLQP